MKTSRNNKKFILFSQLLLGSISFVGVLFAADTPDSVDVNLLDFEVWQRERGYWFGEYTFLNSSGKSDYEATEDSTSGQYDYRRYFGFINLQVKGNELKQRNIFLRPALDLEGKDLDEDGTVSVNELDAFGFSSPFDYAIDLQTNIATPLQPNGDAADLIPFNYNEGTEKTFTADQSASDQSGNLSGLYFGFPTTTTIIGEDTVLYRVGDTPIFQNQLTTLPGNGVRVRTAQGFSFGSSLPSYGSYYRETKFEDDVDEQGVVIMTAREKFLLKLEEYRQLYNVPEVNQIADVADFFTTGLEPAEEQDAKPNEDSIVGESGDMNADGVVNVFDIEPFILALNNPVEFTETTGVNSKTGDLNGDGQVNVFDIEPFVNALNGSTNDPELAQLQAATIKSRVDAYPQRPVHYEAWAEEQGLHSKNNAPYADPNGDGLVNLAAYTIGASALGNNEINVGIETKGDSTTLRFSSPHYVTGVHIGTEVSTALKTGAWTPGPRPVLVRSNSTQNYYEVTIPSNGNRQFARLTFGESR
ncbi:dockerin type I repeat-containing protein [Verrucomicrobiales bacterium]|nr:dockerin type I repeat-containing protein [Verrucomicrobiales bacterium]